MPTDQMQDLRGVKKVCTAVHHTFREHSGSVVECFTQDQRAARSSLTGFTALCP